MKNIYIIILGCISFTLFCVGSTEHVNLVKNGDFEDGSTGWRGDANIVFETPDKKNRICKIAVDKEKSVTFHQEIKTWNIKNVRIKFRIKGSSDYVAESGPGWVVKLGSSGQSRSIRNDWNEMEFTFSNSENKARLNLTFEIKRGQSGSLSFDDIEVLEYIAPEANKTVEPPEEISSPLSEENHTSTDPADEYVTLADKDGRELEVKILGTSLNGESVIVQPKGRKSEVTVPISAFNDQSQSCIRSWIKRSQFLDKKLISIDFDTIEEPGEKYKNKAESGFLFYDAHVSMDLENKSNFSFDNVIVEYALFYYCEDPVDKGGRRFTKKPIYGVLYNKQSLDIGSESKGKIFSEQVKLRKYFPNGGDWPLLESEIEGIIVRLSWASETGNTAVREIVYPEKLKRKWTTETKKTPNDP